MHALASKISKEKAGLAGPHRAFAASRSLALEIFLIPAQIPSFFNLPIHSSSSSSSSSSPLIAESSSAFLPTSSVILVPQPRRPNTLKWANIASALAVCAVTEEELLQPALQTAAEATSPLLLSSPLPSLNSALLQPPCRFSYSLLLPASCETGESYIVVLSSYSAGEVVGGRPRCGERKTEAAAARKEGPGIGPSAFVDLKIGNVIDVVGNEQATWHLPDGQEDMSRMKRG